MTSFAWTLLGVAAVIGPAMAGCLAVANECPDGWWASSEFDGTSRRVDERLNGSSREGKMLAVGVTLCGYQFSVGAEEGVLRLERIREEAHGPLRWSDVRFHVDAPGIEARLGEEVLLLEPEKPVGFSALGGTTLVKIGDQVHFCHRSGSEAPADIGLSQTRFVGRIYVHEGTEGRFDALPACL